MVERVGSLVDERNELFPDYLHIYGGAHLSHFEANLEPSELETAIQKLASFPHTLQKVPMLLQLHASLLLRRFKISPTRQDLEMAIEQAEAVQEFPDAAIDTRIYALSYLADCLPDWAEFQFGDERTQLDNAVKRGLEAKVLVQRHDGGFADVHYVYGALAFAQYRRYQQFQEPADLQGALENGWKAVELSKNGDPDKARWVNLLGLAYMARFYHLAEVSSLETATGLFEQAIELSSERHQTHGLALSNLADALASRFELTGDTEALDIAVSKYRAVASRGNQHVVKSAGNLENLGSLLIDAYDRHSRGELLDEAVDVLNQALVKYPDGHVDLGITHSLLCSALVNRYLSMEPEERRESDIQRAIYHGEQSILLVEPVNLRTRNLPHILSGAHLARWQERSHRDRGDFAKAVKYSRKCLDATPQDAPDRALRLCGYGNLLVAQLVDNDPSTDASAFTEPFSHFAEAVGLPNGPPLIRIKAARKAIGILAEQRKWREARPIGLAAMRLLPLVCGRYLSLQDQQQVVSQTSGIAAEVCSLLLHLDEPEQALEQLEAGRAMMLGFAMDNSDEVSALAATHEDLAKEFSDIKARLRTPPDRQGSRLGEVKLRERRAAEADLTRCLDKIRSIDSHGDFLREPTVDHLKSCSKEGIVAIVNISSLRSDAIILVDSATRVVPLSGLQLQTALDFGVQLISGFPTVDFPIKRAIKILSETVPDQTRQSQSSFADRLWTNCVRPVFDELRHCGAMPRDGKLPRIWWIGSGAAAGLPFHAAASDSDPDQDAMSLCISSYTPSIKALLHAQRRSNRLRALRSEADQAKVDLAIVTMETTPGGHAPLPAVRKEKDAIADLTKGKWNCAHLSQPTASLALEAVTKSDIVHFACHGVADKGDPSQSHLVLEKPSKNGSTKEVDELTVPQFLSLDSLRKAWIAFLSACTTASMGTFRLGDEGLHISGALQIAGFSHVVGSLWEVEDEVGVDVARAFYENLIEVEPRSVDDRMVALALRDAVIRVRERRPSSWTKWAAYIHSGA
ncbi:hypothetical protein ACJ41O_005676 [Fusarium nematophilum]